jgi:hypothetical protein
LDRHGFSLKVREIIGKFITGGKGRLGGRAFKNRDEGESQGPRPLSSLSPMKSKMASW